MIITWHLTPERKIHGPGMVSAVSFDPVVTYMDSVLTVTFHSVLRLLQSKLLNQKGVFQVKQEAAADA